MEFGEVSLLAYRHTLPAWLVLNASLTHRRLPRPAARPTLESEEIPCLASRYAKAASPPNALRAGDRDI